MYVVDAHLQRWCTDVPTPTLTRVLAWPTGLPAQMLALGYATHPDFVFSSKDLLTHLQRALSPAFLHVLTYLGGQGRCTRFPPMALV